MNGRIEHLGGLIKNASIAYKLTLVATLATVIAVSIASWLAYTSSEDLLLDRAVNSMQDSIDRQIERSTLAIHEIKQDTLILSQSEAVAGILRARLGDGYDEFSNMTEADWHGRLNSEFRVLIESKGYSQVRLISYAEDGLEIVRVDGPTFEGGRVRMRTPDEMQSKARQSTSVNQRN